jgi:hypothetical protein
MGIALLKILGFARKKEATAEEQATAKLNMRMQRMLDLHLQANVKPQDLPKAEKAA